MMRRLAAPRVALALVADHPATRRVAAELFPGAARLPLADAALRPHVPFRGDLFTLLGAQPPGTCVGLVVPMTVLREGLLLSSPPPGTETIISVRDHVNLTLRSPLCGRWPESVARAFPALTGIYHPACVRSPREAPVYSDEVVAGVSDATRLSEFEAGAVRSGGLRVISDTLVPAAIIAAHYGLMLAACGVAQADDPDHE